MIFKRMICLSLSLSVISCAALQISPELREKAKSVVVSQGALSLKELQKYEEIGPVTCEERWNTRFDMDESCRDELKIKTARLGGDLVVLEVRDRIQCYSSDGCLYVKGRAYKLKEVSEK